MESRLGGSWVVISRVITRVAILMTHIRGLMTLLLTTHEPPSKGFIGGFRVLVGFTSIAIFGRPCTLNPNP